MRHPYELFAGLRYTRAKRRNHFISFISLASMLGIAVGVMALIVVLSVMNGFETEMRERILGMASHATISAIEGGMDDWQSVATEARKFKEVEAVAPYIEGEGMVKVGAGLSGVLLRGILPADEATVSEVGKSMQAGKLDDLRAGEYGIVIGVELAKAMKVGVGDGLDLMIPKSGGSGISVLPRFRRFSIAGVFNSGMYEIDRGLVIMHIEDAAALYHMPGQVTGVRLRLHDLFDAPRVSRELAEKLPGLYYPSDWTRNHINFFRAVASQKQIMFLILALIVGVAAFNIVSTLVMVVQDKQADIAILRTLGATPRSIMAVFMVQGSIIGVIGTVLGVTLGIILALNVPHLAALIGDLTGQPLIQGEVYGISDLPSRLEATDVIRTGLLSLMLGLLSTLYPAWRASRTAPADALRYE